MMTNRIIRDIRFYELRPENYSGPFDGTIGNIYKKSLDTRYIGQRVALKLNELCFVSGIFDHVYIYMSPFLPDNEMEIQRNELDERFKTVHFGIKPSDFNSLNESNKNLWANDTIFKVLYFLFNHDLPKVNQIKKVEALIEKFNQDIEIFYSSKETRAYKIDINFQIKPNGNSSRIMLTYCDKKKNTIRNGKIDLINHQDIYSLVDKIVVKNNAIILNPRKSIIVNILTEKYKTPLTIDIDNLSI